MSIFIVQALCCDVCLSSFGMSNSTNKTYLALHHAFLKASGRHTHWNQGEDHIHSDESSEYFHTYTLDLQKVTKRQNRIRLFLPYVQNYGKRNEMIGNVIRGIGDASLLYYKKVYQRQKSETSKGFSFLLMTGIEFPTGKHIGLISEPEMEAGSKSWDLLFGSWNQWQWSNSRLTWTNTFKRNSSNSLDFRYGHKLQSELIWIKSIYRNNLRVLLGGSSQFSSHNIWMNQKLIHSGGHVHFGNVGLNFFLKRWTIVPFLSIPIWENLNGSQAKNNYRTTLTINYQL